MIKEPILRERRKFISGRTEETRNEVNHLRSAPLPLAGPVLINFSDKLLARRDQRGATAYYFRPVFPPAFPARALFPSSVFRFSGRAGIAEPPPRVIKTVVACAVNYLVYETALRNGKLIMTIGSDLEQSLEIRVTRESVQGSVQQKTG